MSMNQGFGAWMGGPRVPVLRIGIRKLGAAKHWRRNLRRLSKFTALERSKVIRSKRAASPGVGRVRLPVVPEGGDEFL
jgi:hypothetical protein